VGVSVLIVDDSGFFRKRLHEILGSVPEITVVGAASNGREAIDLVKKFRPDVITMDYEMPVMDGVTAVRHIMAECPTPILMFSSLTYEGARVTLDALEAGAVDFLPKNFEDIARDFGKMQEELKNRILAIAKKSNKVSPSTPAAAAVAPSTDQSRSDFSGIAGQSDTARNRRLAGTVNNGVSDDVSSTARARPLQKSSVTRSASSQTSLSQPTNRPSEAATSAISSIKTAKRISHPVDILLIGASTGGPVAIQKVLSKLPANLPMPVIVVQHMPATFTPAFAERLNSLCAITVKHAEEGDLLLPGRVLVAQGAKQLLITGQRPQVRIVEGDERLSYKPSVDVTFGSAAKAFPGRVLAVVLTGMGADGREGCRMLKQSGSTVFTQSQKSCVIYGMPMAVDKAGYSDASFDIDSMGEQILNGVL
jgi:two-component system chemotaxis response regulator CheB